MSRGYLRGNKLYTVGLSPDLDDYPIRVGGGGGASRVGSKVKNAQKPGKKGGRGLLRK